MGKTRDLFKKTGDTKGTFYAMMGTIKVGPNRSRRDFKKVARIHRTTIQKGS